MKLFIICLSLNFLMLSTMCSVEFSSFVTPCKKDLVDLSKCIVNTLETLRPHLGGGIPKYKIPPLDPFSLPRLEVNHSSDSFTIYAILMTLVISGATKVTVSKLSVNLSDLTGSVSMEFPDLNVSTLYDMDTDVMNSMTLKGVGHCNATISNLKVNLTGKAELTSKDMNGKTYLKLTHVKITMLIGDAVGRLVDSSNDEENIMLTEAANTFYDINRAEILEMFTPIAEEIAEALVTELGGQVLSSLPYNEMFVD